MDKFINCVAKIDWIGLGDVSFNTNQYSDTLIRVICFPLKSFSCKYKGLDWFGERLRDIRSQLHDAKRKFNVSESSSDWVIFYQSA